MNRVQFQVSTAELVQMIRAAAVTGTNPRLGFNINGVTIDWIVMTNPLFTILSGQKA